MVYLPAPVTAADAVNIDVEIVGDLMAKHEVHRPGEQQIIHRSHQAQAIGIAELGGLQAEFDVGTVVKGGP